MANIKLKSTQDLKSWDTKELRKLRMTLKNRIEELQANSKPKEFKEGHPLKDLSIEQCQNLLEKVIKAEKS
jgi:hypothetical protein